MKEIKHEINNINTEEYMIDLVKFFVTLGYTVKTKTNVYHTLFSITAEMEGKTQEEDKNE